MTTIDYIHHRLQQDFGEEAEEIADLLDSLMERYLTNPENDEFPGAQFLANELFYPFFALYDAMIDTGVDSAIAVHYFHRIWEEMPEEIRDDVVEGSAEMLAADKANRLFAHRLE